MDPEPLKPDDARAALDGVDEVRRELAQKATAYPVWRHAAFAAIMAALVLSQGFGLPLQFLLLVAASAAVAWLAADDRRRYGMFINGLRKGHTLPVSIALLVGLVFFAAAEIVVRIGGLPLTPKLGIAAIAFLLALESSYAWNRAFRRELRGHPR